MELKEFNKKKVLILGLGREGLDSLKFLLKWAPGTVKGIADRNDAMRADPGVQEAIKGAGIERYFGADYLAEIRNYDIIVKSPGIPIHIPQISELFRENKITSQTQIFFDHCPGTVVGVTGTKGKSTTASLINDVLLEAGYKSRLVGNIGQPVLSYLADSTEDDFFVYELSAHQLYGLNKSPHIAVLINLYPEHLDYYSDFNEYVSAKANIAIHQSIGDYFIFNSAIQECEKIAEACQGKKIAYNESDWSFSGKISLIGKANMQNAKIAAIVGKILGVADERINKAVGDFKPLSHRLEFAGEYGRVKFYNDSLSTIQESAVVAIESLGDDLQTLIAGGFDRRQPFEKLARAILNSRIANLILFAPTGQRIWDELSKSVIGERDNERIQAIKHFFVGSMDEAVDVAFKNTESERICLLSAASASFGTFHDYAQRGESFKESIINHFKR